MREHAEGSYYALIIRHRDDRVKMHFKMSKYVEVPLPENFLDTLRLFANQKMWDFMHLDDDREWISEEMRNDTLDVAHTGS